MFQAGTGAGIAKEGWGLESSQWGHNVSIGLGAGGTGPAACGNEDASLSGAGSWDHQWALTTKFQSCKMSKSWRTGYSDVTAVDSVVLCT